MSSDTDKSLEQRQLWEKALAQLNSKRERTLAELRNIEINIVELSVKLGRDVSHLTNQAPAPTKSYQGWPPGDAVRDYLKAAGTPQSEQTIVDALTLAGANSGNVKRALKNAASAPGKRKDGSIKTPGLKVYPDGRIGLPEWPDAQGS